MQKIRYSITIQAPVGKVYDCMLGLTSKSSYEYWTAAFNPTSTYEGSWEKGTKIRFVGTDEHGKKGGMLSEVEDNQPGHFVSLRHYGFINGDEDITTGEQVEKWAGGHENYHFSATTEGTLVTVEMDTLEDYLDYFNQTYPKALIKLKELAEQSIN